MGGGVPIGAMLATEKVAASFGPGTHGSTFGGNPLSCTAALTVLDVIEANDLLENVQQRSAQLQQGLKSLACTYACIKQVRGQGLLIGAELNIEVAPLIASAREKGLLVLMAGPNVLRFLPPLNVSTDEVDEALKILADVFADVCANEIEPALEDRG
ncbi:MAG: aminotransferase class III-fold pyridoxal phosphate-dependent enzyme [Mariprofundus sp.]